MRKYKVLGFGPLILTGRRGFNMKFDPGDIVGFYDIAAPNIPRLEAYTGPEPACYTFCAKRAPISRETPEEIHTTPHVVIHSPYLPAPELSAAIEPVVKDELNIAAQTVVEERVVEEPATPTKMRKYQLGNMRKDEIVTLGAQYGLELDEKTHKSVLVDSVFGELLARDLAEV